MTLQDLIDIAADAGKDPKDLQMYHWNFDGMYVPVADLGLGFHHADGSWRMELG